MHCIVMAMTMLFSSSHYSASAAQEACIDPQYARSMAIGGTISGVGAGIVSSIIAGSAPAVSLAAAGGLAGGGVGVLIAVDCSTTLCLGTVLAGAALSAAAIWAYLFSNDPENCAGALYYSPKAKGFTMNWDKDSNSEATKDGKKYCEETYGGTCEPVLLFRECAALARDRENRVFGAGTSSVPRQAERQALDRCRQEGGETCALTIPARCNSG